VGINSRLDAIQAAILSVKLRHIDSWNARRRDRAALYARRLRAWGVDADLVRPPAEAGAAHVFHLYTVRADRRDALREALGAAGVDTQVYYPVPLHLQPCFADLGYRHGDFPHAERAAAECLSLPLYPELSDEQVEHVVSTIGAFHGRPRP
jgi:dTDP-4-amino-4,6-dideoxygalactose transaminase